MAHGKNLLKNIDELDGIGSAQLKSLEQFFSSNLNSEIILSLIEYLKIKNSKILNKNGNLKDIAKASDQLNLQALTIPVVKYFICYPK